MREQIVIIVNLNIFAIITLFNYTKIFIYISKNIHQK